MSKLNATAQATGEAVLPASSGYTSIEDVSMNEAIVHRIMRGGGTDADCVIVLANSVREMRKQIMELDSIAPKKVRTKDGKTYVWHCPDDLIPASRTIEV